LHFGNVKWFNEIKGVGMIRDLEGGEYPIHFSEILEDGFRTLFEGEAVGFEITPRQSGQVAVRVRRLSGGCMRGCPRLGPEG
jgi:CspA family cold shock protein